MIIGVWQEIGRSSVCRCERKIYLAQARAAYSRLHAKVVKKNYERMTTVIIIPTYNEKENVREIISQVFRYMPQSHILIVDDNSPDGTADIVKEIQRDNGNIFLLERAGKEGLGKAYIHAFNHVLANMSPTKVVMMDADMSHHPRYLPVMENMLRPNSVIVGSRYIPGGDTVGWEPWRKGLSYFGNIYARTITGIPVNDLTAGFYMIDADLLRTIDLTKIDASGYAFQIELKNLFYRSGAELAELPIIFGNRVGGESKISNHIISEGIIAPWKIRLRK